MKIITRLLPYMLIIAALANLIVGFFNDSSIHTAIGILFLVLFDNHITHTKLRELEATVLATGMVTWGAVTKGKARED